MDILYRSRRFRLVLRVPRTPAFLFGVSVVGMTTNRELPPEQTGLLPPGATPVRSDTASEQIASAVDLVASGDVDGRFAVNGQVGVVFRFFAAMREGRYEDGLACADDDWRLCRIQAWLWNNQTHFGDDADALQVLADSLFERGQPAEVWADFLAVERQMFVDAWGPLHPDAFGAASRRRRLSRSYDLVVLAPVGTSGGYFVTTATAIPDALVFVVHHKGAQWLVANHVGTAPPEPGWPPVWWNTNDPAIDGLPDS